MLLAEIQGKLRGTFGCTACGNDRISPEALVATEDALTSTAFGALRWLRPDLGLLPFLRLLGLPFAASAVPTVRLWPWDTIPVVGIGATKFEEVGCEPDVTIDLPEQSFVVVEVKLGAILGSDPLQLPKEAIFAHRHARGRPWRLLCVTPSTTAPHIQGFSFERGRLALGQRMPLAEAVASYFAATTPLRRSAGLPSASEVRAAVCWMSWSSFGALFEAARAQASTAPHERTLLDDVVAIFRRRGLIRPVFHGFEVTRAQSLRWNAGVIWRRGRKPLWSISSKVTPWSASPWLSAGTRTRSSFRGFSEISVRRPTPWPKLQWLSTGAKRRR